MEATTKKKKFQFPDVYALIFILCCLAMVLTWIIPAGTFERVTEGTLTKVVAGTFQHVDSSPQTPWAMLQAIYQGFINSAGTIFLIFFCGASVAMVEESHALSDFFTWLARKLKGKEMLAIAILMYGLGLGNAAGAFANIGVALMPIGIVMSNAIGGDAFLAFLIIYYGLQSGFSIGFANPWRGTDHGRDPHLLRHQRACGVLPGQHHLPVHRHHAVLPPHPQRPHQEPELRF